MKSLSTAAVGAALALGLASVVQAQIPGDANKDGKLSQTEFVTGASNLIMAALDLDHDGRIARDEFKARRDAAQHLAGGVGASIPSSIVPLDQNRDGSATRAEVEAMLVKRFHSLDNAGNGDGFLTANELK